MIRGLFVILIMISFMASVGANEKGLQVLIKGDQWQGQGKVFLVQKKNEILQEGEGQSFSFELNVGMAEVIIYNVPNGEYLLWAYLDSNQNKQFDKKGFYPQEPVGFSNDIKLRMGPPDFKGMMFSIDDKPKKISITLHEFTKKWNVGVGLIAKGSAYREIPLQVLPIPMISYVGERFSLLGPQMSYRLIKTRSHTFALQLRPQFFGYEEEDDAFYEGLGDRKWTLLAGLQFQFRWKDYRLMASWDQDILGRFDGGLGSFQFSRNFVMGDFSLTPSFGLHFYDDAYVRYYYGVEKKYAKTDRPTYWPSFAINPYLSIFFKKDLGRHWVFLANIRWEWLDEKIYESPLVERHFESNVLLAFNYSF